MIDVVMNPENIDGLYLECLNRCFGEWGGPAMYRWCFDRRLGGRKPDIMLLKKKGAILGGSAVTYRHAMLNNVMVRIAVMTGSWTLSEARNQGCFTMMVGESLSLAKEAGAALLMAFVTEKNPSTRRLLEKGSATFPSHYLVSPLEGDIRSAVPVSATQGSTRCSLDISRLMKAESAGRARFVYSPDEWRSQFIDRTEMVEFVCIEDTCVGVIEKKGIFDRLLAFTGYADHSREDVLKACCARSLDNARRLFLFTTSSSLKDYAVEIGFERIPGYITALIADEGALKTVFPVCPDGKIAPSGLYDPHSPWYIGEWDLTAGDRM